MLTEKQLNKLPKYVKDEIDRLNNRISDLRKETLAFSEKMPTNIVCVMPSGEELSLPKDSIVRFFFNNTIVDIYCDENELDIYGHTKISVMPVASNRIIIKGDFYE